MEKIKNALKSVNKFGLTLVLLTAITLMSFSAAKQKVTSTEYGRTSTGWVLVDDVRYECDQESTDVCKAHFLNDPNGTNPQMDPSIPTIYEGIYVLRD